MWNFFGENGRQIWAKETPAEEANKKYDDLHKKPSERPTHTVNGIPYNGLPFMTDGIIHSHTIKGGADERTKLYTQHKPFNSINVQSSFDIPTPLTDAEIDVVVKQSQFLSNPNTGDDIYRRQVIPAEMYCAGSCTTTTAVGALQNNPNIRTIHEDKKGVVHDWNRNLLEKKEIPVDYFAEKYSKEGIEAQRQKVNQDIKDCKPITTIDLTNCPEEELWKQIEQSAIASAEYFKHVQASDGHIACDYGGPMFLLPGLIFTCYITETHLSKDVKLEMIKYLFSHQRKDGGWGLHIESQSTMFGTTLNYVSLRLLGVRADIKQMKLASSWIKSNGGAAGCPNWGKFWLATLNLFPWDGMNAIFPEVWLLPEALPIHPSRFWCHCRMVYLPMAYIYGAKFQAELTPLLRDIRDEIYMDPYNEINFYRFRDYLAETDRFHEGGCMLAASNLIMNIYEDYTPSIIKNPLRKRALDFILGYISAEDEQTNYITIGPVGKFINMLACFHGYGPKSTQVRLHQARVSDYLWLAEDGIKCQGYNGSQLWDTAFTVQAFTTLEKGINTLYNKTNPNKQIDLKDQFQYSPLRPFFENAYKYVEDTQIRDETYQREKYYRQVAQGGWPFSTRDHGWPISDCTAEGLKATLALHQTGLIDVTTVVDPLSNRPRYVDIHRIKDAVNVMLQMQNPCGGWATYELKRGPSWLEGLNPSQVFGGIMVDYPYVECTSACCQALTKSLVVLEQVHKIDKQLVPQSLITTVKDSIKRGIDRVIQFQREDGSWVGSWGVCFTYAFWFAMEAMALRGETYQTSPIVKKGVDFILQHQNKDGGWGESFESCVTKTYCSSYDRSLIAADASAEELERSRQEPVSMVINTAWVLLGLLYIGYHNVDRHIMDRALKFLMSRQLPNGDFPQEGISGVFNGNCMITYTSYRSVFPTWAMGMYLEKVCK
jgi:squalene/oxidosqualene cyclase-like protein